ncbi:MAG: UDP-N-acetylmuramate dehydrogenase [Anaerolineales bacterium]|nr:UDP-N-acetylmuramate dehydrogenase [Anaerolineales bacterium]
MVEPGQKPVSQELLQTIFADRFSGRLQHGTPLKRYTAARLGGPADALLEVQSVEELAEAVRLAWENEVAFVILGGGSNVLVSDAGVRGLVLVNKARAIRFDENAETPGVWAESGANFGLLARQVAQRGLAGLEWAVSVPGTLGGAIVGNAGAHGSDMSASLWLAEILHRIPAGDAGCAQCETWPVEKFEYSYRSSWLKRSPGKAIVLSAILHLTQSSPEAVQAKMEEFVNYRKRTQPAGASLGSMFKNPPGDYAGRLIEAAGLKGARSGDVEISPVHANFFVNGGQAMAAHVYQLIQLARQTVADKFGVELELEIELLGEW